MEQVGDAVVVRQFGSPGFASRRAMTDRSYRDELEALPTDALYRQARRRATRRLDVRFFWSLLRAIPAAEAAAGDLEHAEADVGSSIMRVRDLGRAGEGELGEALRPLYIDYLVKHPSKRGD